MPKKKFSDAEIAEIVTAYGEYIDRNEDPVIPEFTGYNLVANKYWVTKDDISHYPQFHKLTKRLLDKQETAQLRKGPSQPAMAIFRLKQPQFGYRDKIENDFTSDGKPIQFMNAVPRVKRIRPDRVKDKEQR